MSDSGWQVFDVHELKQEGADKPVQIGDEIKDVGPGSLMYVRATEAHSFFEIQEDMVLLVLFATGKP